MKKLQLFHGSLELPQNGNLAHARTKEELLTILGFRSADSSAEVGDKVEGISVISQAEREHPRPGNDLTSECGELVDPKKAR